MNRIEKITHHGKPYVAVPVALYEKMLEAVEDASDAAVASEVLAALTSGKQETFSLALVDALAEATTAGERLTLWRNHRGYSKVALGRMIGVSGQYISQIESGDRKGSAAILRKIAVALCCTLDDLI
jgi:DNA-binding XRE family transcriptional regulator